MTDPAPAASTQRAESPGRLARPLIRLAHAYGVATSFIDQLGTYVENSDEAIAGVLAALGVDASTSEAIDASIARVRRERKERLIIPTIVATVGEATDVPVNCEASDHPHAVIELEEGVAYDGEPEFTPHQRSRSSPSSPAAACRHDAHAACGPADGLSHAYG